MSVLLLTVALSLLVRSCMCAPEQEVGCRQWVGGNGDEVCCKTCFKGYQLVKECGKVNELCKLCDPGTFSPKSNKSCQKCSECVGNQIIVKKCDFTTDTQCGCKEGMLCGDERCSFCVKKCEKGHQHAVNGSCKPCPEGTFNNPSHSECKAWSTKCPPGQVIVTHGDAFNDIKCGNGHHLEPSKSSATGSIIDSWMVVLIIAAIIGMVLVIIIAMLVRRLKKHKIYSIHQDKKDPEFFICTDDPKTLIAVECSFHEAEMEQGTSCGSMDSSVKLVR